jgi:transmembrane sensor
MSKTDHKLFQELLSGYLNESLTSEELDEFFIQAKLPENGQLLDASVDLGFQQGVPDLTDKDQSREAFEKCMASQGIGVHPSNNKVKRIGFPLRWAAAVLILLVSGAAVYIMSHPGVNKNHEVAAGLKKTGQPGHNGGVLHFSNGDSLLLDNQPEGKLITEGSVQASIRNGYLTYAGINSEGIYHKITTGRGRQWSLELPDHTKVWLNAASSIYYPLNLNRAERLVEITGEVYFEVVHDPAKPFRVKVAGQIVEDLGTSFNINAYPDEPEVTTSLLRGSIKVTSGNMSKSIEPGEQTVVPFSGGNIQIRQKVDVQDAVAWKYGFFNFHNADLQSVMRQLSRWYDVDIRFEGPIHKELFSGEIGKNLTLTQVFKGLEQSNIHYKIEEGGTVVILP